MTKTAALLDVNVLLALSWDQHIHHEAAHQNFGQLAGDWATTPVTEAGLIRLLMTPAVVGRSVDAAEALWLLGALRSTPGWRWIPDTASFADAWVDVRVLLGRRQVTDLHLVDVAARNSAVLATFDAGIRAALTPSDRRYVEVWTL